MYNVILRHLARRWASVDYHRFFTTPTASQYHTSSQTFCIRLPCFLFLKYYCVMRNIVFAGKSLSECFDGGNRTSLNLCLHILRQLLECLVYLKENNITHGDIRCTCWYQLLFELEYTLIGNNIQVLTYVNV